MIDAYLRLSQAERWRRRGRALHMLAHFVAFGLMVSRWWLWGVALLAVCVVVTLPALRRDAKAHPPTPRVADPDEDPAIFVVAHKGGGTPIIIHKSLVLAVMHATWDVLYGTLDVEHASTAQRAAAAAAGFVQIDGDAPRRCAKGELIVLALRAITSSLSAEQHQEIQRVAAGDPPVVPEVATYLAKLGLFAVENSRSRGEQVVARPVARAVAWLLEGGGAR